MKREDGAYPQWARSTGPTVSMSLPSHGRGQTPSSYGFRVHSLQIPIQSDPVRLSQEAGRTAEAKASHGRSSGRHGRAQNPSRVADGAIWRPSLRSPGAERSDRVGFRRLEPENPPQAAQRPLSPVQLSAVIQHPRLQEHRHRTQEVRGRTCRAIRRQALLRGLSDRTNERSRFWYWIPQAGSFYSEGAGSSAQPHRLQQRANQCQMLHRPQLSSRLRRYPTFDSF